MDNSFESLLVCPVCHGELYSQNTEYRCRAHEQDHRYPVLDRIPILISEDLGTFSLSAYSGRRRAATQKSLRQRLRSFIPRISLNVAARKNFAELRRLLLLENARPRVLVLGGAEMGAGMEEILADERIDFLETDVAIGPRTQMICDASHIPLQTESVDAVIIQAVLEYIPDPVQTVGEIYRVLKPRGLVYSEMPFMQDVHGGRYDFTRLTHLGHLRLYRHFEEISSGACAGPGCALAWALQHFFLSFVKAPLQRDMTKTATGLLFFWLKYFDFLLARTPGGLDGATGTYLLARKSARILSDRELIQSYRGGVPATNVI